jgi:hypothetical protein
MKLIAKAIKKSFVMHEQSWDPGLKRYKLTMAVICNFVCNQLKIDERFSFLCYLIVDTWPNDADDWATNILKEGGDENIGR